MYALLFLDTNLKDGISPAFAHTILLLITVPIDSMGSAYRCLVVDGASVDKKGVLIELSHGYGAVIG